MTAAARIAAVRRYGEAHGCQMIVEMVLAAGDEGWLHDPLGAIVAILRGEVVPVEEGAEDGR